jgi:hypothetical protein
MNYVTQGGAFAAAPLRLTLGYGMQRLRRKNKVAVPATAKHGTPPR